MSRKDMKRTNWPRVLQKDYIAKDFDFDGRHGQVSLSILRELTAPLTVHYPFGDVLIADKDYSWLQFALKGAYVWLTAMYDRHGQLINLYFDITDGNRFDDPENPCFEDMYLDIAIVGDTMTVLDQDELDAALQNGDITRAQFDHAETVCRELYAYLTKNKSEVIGNCETAYRGLMEQIK